MTTCPRQVHSPLSCSWAAGLTLRVFQLPLATVGWLVFVIRAVLGRSAPDSVDAETPDSVDGESTFPVVTTKAVFRR